MKKLFDYKIKIWQLIASALIFIMAEILINGDFIGVGKLLTITNGISIPDMNFYYSADKLLTILNEMGTAGRNYYLTTIIPLDFLFPASYCLFLFCFLSFFYSRLLKTSVLKNMLLLIPFIGAAADYMENLGNIFVTLNFPDSGLISWLPGIFSVVKFSFIAMALLLTVTGIISLIIKTIHRKISKSGRLKSEI